jgi:hypothetical protein
MAEYVKVHHSMTGFEFIYEVYITSPITDGARNREQEACLSQVSLIPVSRTASDTRSLGHREVTLEDGSDCLSVAYGVC